MKHSIKNLLALLIVFGATSSAFAADSAYMATVCKIVAEQEKMYRVMFYAPTEESVSVQIKNSNQQIVYIESLKSSEFVKKYDLSYLPKGTYELEVKSAGYVFKEEFELGSLKDFNFDFSQLAEKSAVSLVGSQAQGKDVTLYILDANQDVVYKEGFDDTKQVHKKYNLEKLGNQKVTFLLYHDDQLIKKEAFDF
ncbi:MAG: hypothetical protein CMB80_12700 [Flammeovirgaceae bacterium]|nr:hypothetical protein [Flammeovirgaceae bacterium]MBE62556.1 hypothetical protein [Flammeovirgaceae bacterium]HCX23895.1 hypothetical protein [Cytophagales bacterium]|tara:strand:+ start:534 stop:1118 length:585 start_codon:yes stop_codon:yes gene_type:complete